MSLTCIFTESKQDHSQDEHEDFINFDNCPQARTLDIVDMVLPNQTHHISCSFALAVADTSKQHQRSILFKIYTKNDHKFRNRQAWNNPLSVKYKVLAKNSFIESASSCSGSGPLFTMLLPTSLIILALLTSKA